MDTSTNVLFLLNNVTFLSFRVEHFNCPTTKGIWIAQTLKQERKRHVKWSSMSVFNTFNFSVNEETDSNGDFNDSLLIAVYKVTSAKPQIFSCLSLFSCRFFYNLKIIFCICFSRGKYWTMNWKNKKKKCFLRDTRTIEWSHVRVNNYSQVTINNWTKKKKKLSKMDDESDLFYSFVDSTIDRIELTPAKVILSNFTGEFNQRNVLCDAERTLCDLNFPLSPSLKHGKLTREETKC